MPPESPPPSPAEIAERAAEIRATWTEDERLQRLAGPGRLCTDRRTPREPKIREYATPSDGRSARMLG